MNNLAEIFEAELKRLAANFAESWALKFFHWLRKSQAKLFSSESCCLLCGKRSIQTNVCKGEWAMLGWLLGRNKTGLHFPETVPSLRPQAGGEGTPLDVKSSLTCMATHVLPPLRVLGKPVASRLEKACQGLLPSSFSLPALIVCLLTSCSLRRLCHPITSPLLSSGPLLLCTLSLSLTLS